MQKKAAVDLPALQSLGGQVVEDGISICGWKIQTHHEPIIGDAAVEEYKSELGGVISIPEIIFGNSFLKITHEKSETCLSFSALHALKAWKTEDLPPLQVNIAEQWQEARQNEIDGHGAKQLEYDWTFTTPYAGTLDRESHVNGNGAVAAVATPHFVESEGEIDWALLTSQDPILFFDSFTLYESELNDTGACQFEVKVRCMPKCWFVLSRFWLRVDNNLVRLREARIFCRFDKDKTRNIILRSLRHAEGTFEELKNSGAPPEGPAYKDSDTTATAMQAIAPTGVKLMKSEMLELGS